MIKINNFWGDLSGISAKTPTLLFTGADMTGQQDHNGLFCRWNAARWVKCCTKSLYLISTSIHWCRYDWTTRSQWSCLSVKCRKISKMLYYIVLLDVNFYSRVQIWLGQQNHDCLVCRRNVAVVPRRLQQDYWREISTRSGHADSNTGPGESANHQWITSYPCSVTSPQKSYCRAGTCSKKYQTNKLDVWIGCRPKFERNHPL